MEETNHTSPPPTFAIYISVSIISMSSLIFEINLTRLFSVSQFYHFAFMIVSIALLGMGASGTYLSIFRRKPDDNPVVLLKHYALGTGISIITGYIIINHLPFDSFSIAWDFKQVFILALHYLVLAVPFFFVGLAVSSMLDRFSDHAGKIYAANLTGSSLGCIIAALIPSSLGVEGSVMFSAALAFFAVLISWYEGKTDLAEECPQKARIEMIPTLLSFFLLAFCVWDTGARAFHFPTFKFLDLQISPYKGLSYALQYPDSEVIDQRWNAYSRVDIVSSTMIRSLTGLSFRFDQAFPAETGLFIDGDNLNPIIQEEEPLVFTRYLPQSIAYELRPSARVLLLETRGGSDILTALENGGGMITAVEPNPLVINAADHIYTHPDVDVVVNKPRGFLNDTGDTYEVILYTLTDTYHPVHSGAYSLSEDYTHTVESYQNAISHLAPNGLLVIPRWLQLPPSEWLRVFTTAVTAMENLGLDPRSNIAAIRGYNVGVLFVSNHPLTSIDLAELRAFSNEMAYDIVFAPDISPDEVNKFSVLQKPVYFEAFSSFLNASDREKWLKEYPYDVTPPTDNHPFFAHFFKWSQARHIFNEIGKTMQPFGGAGYFVLLLILGFAILAAGILILMPLAVNYILNKRNTSPGAKMRSINLSAFGYFGFIGLGFLFIEIPLIQHFILLLGNPSTALTVVLFAMLLFSGIGSFFANHIPHQITMGMILILTVISPWLVPFVTNYSLGFPYPLRIAVTCITLAPFGFFMGMMFPRGIVIVERTSSGSLPWIWAVNGTVSVIASVLSTLIAMTFGYSAVLWIGSICYAGAWFTASHLQVQDHQSPHP